MILLPAACRKSTPDTTLDIPRPAAATRSAVVAGTTMNDTADPNRPRNADAARIRFFSRMKSTDDRRKIGVERDQEAGSVDGMLRPGRLPAIRTGIAYSITARKRWYDTVPARLMIAETVGSTVIPIERTARVAGLRRIGRGRVRLASAVVTADLRRGIVTPIPDGDARQDADTAPAPPR